MNVVWLLGDALFKASMIIFGYAIGTAVITPMYTYMGIL